MRNRIVHQYHAVNLDVVWDSIVNDIPVLQGAVSRLLAELESRQDIKVKPEDEPQPSDPRI